VAGKLIAAISNDSIFAAHEQPGCGIVRDRDVSALGCVELVRLCQKRHTNEPDCTQLTDPLIPHVRVLSSSLTRSSASTIMGFSRFSSPIIIVQYMRIIISAYRTFTTAKAEAGHNARTIWRRDSYYPCSKLDMLPISQPRIISSC
jgi:hypothetical protein